MNRHFMAAQIWRSVKSCGGKNHGLWVLRKTCRKSLILRFKMPKLEEVSYDILVLEASYVKCPRRLARNACFRSRLHETCMNFCAKRSFWKLTKLSFLRSWEVLLAFRKVAQRS